MRYSKIALLSTLSAFALLTASTGSRAFSPSVTDMGLLKPHGVWQVGSINAENATYCAMVSQFDKEISLAFARSPAGYGSLAIDFPGGILDTGMTYPITLQVDDMEARQFNVRAASPRSIIVQIGQDEDFYTSLGSNGTLRISMPTVDMKFDLKKFSGSYISLISCADKLPPHDGPRTAAVPVTPVEKTPLAQTQSADNGVKTAAATTPSKPIALVADKSSAPVSTPAPAASPVATETAEASDDMQMQMNAVRKSLHEKGVDTAASTATPVLSAPQKNTVAANSLTTQEKTTSPVTVQHAPDIVWAAAQERKEQDSKLSEQKAAVNNLAEQNRNITEENIELRSKLVQSETEETELKNNLDLLKTEKNGLQTKIDMQDKQTKLMEAALSAKERDLSSVRSLSIADSKTLSEVQEELNGLKRDHAIAVAELQSKLSEKMAAYDMLQKQFTDVGEVRRSTQEQATAARTELDMARQQLSQAQSQLASAEQQKNELATQIETQGQQNKSLFEKMQGQLDKAREQVSMLESQMMSVAMQRDDLASKLDTESKQNKMLQASLEAKEQEIASLQQTKPAAAPPVYTSKAEQPATVAPQPLPAKQPNAAPETSSAGTGSTVSSMLPPPLSPAPAKTAKNDKNLSSSKEGSLPAITTPQTIGQDELSSAPPPVLKASIAGAAGSTGPTDESWDTVVVQ